MFENTNAFAEQLEKKYGTSLLKKIQASQEISISRSTLDEWRKKGLIKSQKIGSQVRFHVTEVARVVMDSK